MFKKILIANRGEIACRIIRTARRLGIETAVTVSTADVHSLAARSADEAIGIGPPPAGDSYLDIGRVVGAARACGADAVHPGYGFLSENAAFVEALTAAGITFIGPPAAAIAAMGDKLRAKALAQAAGVSTVPGADTAAPDAKAAAKVAAEIGYPVMLKAAAGGGGKGMRIVGAPGELRSAFRSAENEARSAFGDNRIFVEKYIAQPRHIEIQVVADAHGQVIHLGERECSIQRRHQKVIEESPSPFIDDATRAAMGAQAIALARAVGYTSAGTVEFIVGANRRFYFLEMNTRLQVEHPVTELVTGLDLVELMLRVAAGEPLPLTQEQVARQGWALECRVYAEDPVRNFLPATGRLVRYHAPPDAPGIRLDSGVEEGDEVGMYYDPMLAKLVTHGADRAAAIAGMRRALDNYYIRGVTSNVSFLGAVLAHPRFAAGDISTDFIAEVFPGGFAPSRPDRAVRARIAAVAATITAIEAARGGGDAAGNGPWVVDLAGAAVPVGLTAIDGGYRVEIDGEAMDLRTRWQPGQPLFHCTVAGAAHTVQVDRDGIAYRLAQAGVEVAATVLRPRVSALLAGIPAKAPPDTSRALLSPMPGRLTSLLVELGQTVKAGEELAIVEAMKMENILNADRDGIVKTIHVRPGDNLTADQAILEFE